MKDLDLYTTHTRDVVRPTMVVVPGGPVDHVEEKRGFVVRTRGDTSGTVMHTYRCPVHGEFDAMVPRSQVPDAVKCQIGHKEALDSNCDVCGVAAGEMCKSDCSEHPSNANWNCYFDSPWCGSRCGIGVSAGYVES